MSPIIPHIDWSQLDREQLIAFYEKSPTPYPEDEKQVIITLVNLVKKGRVRAFLTPEGEIVYQHKEKSMK